MYYVAVGGSKFNTLPHLLKYNEWLKPFRKTAHLPILFSLSSSSSGMLSFGSALYGVDLAGASVGFKVFRRAYSL